MRIELSPEIAYRVDFSLLCNARGHRKAAEIGTDRGIFAVDFLSRWNGETLYCVDPYSEWSENTSPRESTRAQAVMALAAHYRRVRFLEVPSPEAASFIPPWDRPLDFVYIDGNHERDAVAADIAAWWPLVAEGGILAGHDYDPGHPGVIAAVEAFAKQENLIVRLTREELASWYVYKREPETLHVRFFDDRDIPNPDHRV